MFKVYRLLLTLLLFYPPFVRGAYVEIIPVSSYGWLDQYSMNIGGSEIGDEACVPTTSTNALTYLQNAVPAVFGKSLSGSTYADWMATDGLLIELMGTTVEDGTFYDRFVYVMDDYVTETKGYPNVQFSGMFPKEVWSLEYPKPAFITPGVPSIPFLTNAIAAGSAVLTSIEYENGGGHDVLVNGLFWDPDTQTGLIYFVDPLDPSENYSPDIPLGPVKQTVGTLELSDDGTKLILRYPQYAGGLPYDGSYGEATASLLGALSIGGAPFVPFAQLLSTGNMHAIAAGFDALDPTTSAMFPIMAVLNTSTDIEGAFAQLDPSVFDPIVYTAQAAAQNVRLMVSNNLLQYRNLCDCSCSAGCLRLWGAPFNVCASQDGLCGHSGYDNTIQGAAIGLDSFPCRSVIAGAAFSYANSDVSWKRARAKGDVQSYGGTVYGGWDAAPYWIEASFGYAYDHVKASRKLSFFSAIPFVEPYYAKLSHRENIQTYAVHGGGSYNLCKRSCGNIEATLWPFVNVDFIYGRRSSFKERGDSVFAQTIASKHSTLALSEWGVGASLCRPLGCDYRAFLHTSLSYVAETYLGSRRVNAYFNDAPDSAFTVSGLCPKNDLVRPVIMIGVKSPDDLFRLHIAYRGDFGGRYIANEVSAEVSLAF